MCTDASGAFFILAAVAGFSEIDLSLSPAFSPLDASFFVVVADLREVVLEGLFFFDVSQVFCQGCVCGYCQGESGDYCFVAHSFFSSFLVLENHLSAAF